MRSWGKRREPWHRARRRAGLGPVPRCPTVLWCSSLGLASHAPAAKPSLTIHPFGVGRMRPMFQCCERAHTTSMGSRPTDVTGVSCSILSTVPSIPERLLSPSQNCLHGSGRRDGSRHSERQRSRDGRRSSGGKSRCRRSGTARPKRCSRQRWGFPRHELGRDGDSRYPDP
jgi:hypothetical protein